MWKGRNVPFFIFLRSLFVLSLSSFPLRGEKGGSGGERKGA